MIAFPFGGTPPPARSFRHVWLSIRGRASQQGILDGVLRLMRPSWSLLGPSWRPLGAAWGLFGRSRGGLGASWAPLGPSWRRSKTKQKCHAKKEQLCITPPLLFGPILDAKINQNRTQNESKFKTIFKSEKVALQEPLGAVLGSSWGILGAILGSQKSLRYRQT